MIVDIGAGDGRAVLDWAVADSRAVVIGVDANAAALAEVSRRASRGRTHVANAVFLAAAAEALPGPLGAVASIVTVTMPWGSLLRGVLGRDARVLAGVASIVAPGGRVEVLTSVQPSDGIEGLPNLDESARAPIAAAWREVGFELVEMHPATPADVAASRSSWAKRLGDRPIWRIVVRRVAG